MSEKKNQKKYLFDLFINAEVILREYQFIGFPFSVCRQTFI